MFHSAMRNRGATAPPGLQYVPQSLAYCHRPDPKTNPNGSHSSPLLPHPSPIRASHFPEPPMVAAGNNKSTPNKRKVTTTLDQPIRTPKRRQTQFATLKANPRPTPPSPDTGSRNIRSLASLGRLLDEAETDVDMPDLSFLDDWSAVDSKSPERSQVQPRTPPLSPVKALSRFRDRNGVWHEVTAVILDDNLSEDGAEGAESCPETVSWGRKRLRERPAKITVVKDDDNDLWFAGPLVPSIERDPYMAPRPRTCHPHRTAAVYDSDNADDENEIRANPSVTRVVSIAPPMHRIPSFGGNEVANGNFEDVDAQINANPDDEYFVKRISGEKIGPNIHEFRIEWTDYPQIEWIPAELCSCPDAITEFRSLQKRELFTAMVAGRADEVERLQRLAEADKAEVENAIFPKHPGWKCNRRGARGRFVPRGTGNLTVEILRDPTVPRNLRAGTARPSNRRRIASDADANGPANEHEVVWVFQEAGEARRRQGQTAKCEATSEMSATRVHRDLRLERNEIQRRKRQDATEQRRRVEQEAAGTDRRRAEEETKLAEEKDARKARIQEKKRLEAAEALRLEVEAEEARRREVAQREAQRKEAEKSQRKAQRRQQRELENQQRAAAAEKELEEEASRRKKELLEKANAAKQKALEETVRKGRSPTIAIAEGSEHPRFVSNNKKRKLQQTLANAAQSAAEQENARQPSSSSRTHLDQSIRASSTVSISTKFRNARAEEANAKAKEKPSIVRSEFRRDLGERQAEALVQQSRVIPPAQPRNRRKTFSN